MEMIIIDDSPAAKDWRKDISEEACIRNELLDPQMSEFLDAKEHHCVLSDHLDPRISEFLDPKKNFIQIYDSRHSIVCSGPQMATLRAPAAPHVVRAQASRWLVLVYGRVSDRHVD